MSKKDVINKLKKTSSRNLPIFSLFLKIDRKDQSFNKVKITVKNLFKSREIHFDTKTKKAYFKKISTKIRNYIEQNIPQTRYHGIAIFAGGDDNFFEVVELNLIPKTVQNVLILDREPFLDVFDFYNKRYRKFALNVANEKETNLFLIQGNDILKIKKCSLKIKKKSKRDRVFRSDKGSSGDGKAENLNEKKMDLDRLFKKINTDLNKICQTENVNALILAGTKKVLPIMEKELPKTLEKLVITKWTNDLSKLDETSLLNKVKDFEKKLK